MAQSSAAGGSSMVGPVAGIVVGLVLVIIGQFFLDGPADESQAWHWIQHGVLFAGGMAIGVGATMAWASGRRG